MGRPLNPDLTKYWKICLPATLAGTVEFYLFDKLHNKPRYGTRGKLITQLLEGWVHEQKTMPGKPTREQLEKALNVATNMLIKHEPSDSRAVSNEFVAIAAVQSNQVDDNVMQVLDTALAASKENELA